MQIPDTLKIGGHNYTVKSNPTCAMDDGSVSMGRHCGSQEIIEINPNYSPSAQANTLLHEIIEAVNWSYELGLEHNQITALDCALFQILKDNKLHFDE